MPFRIENHYGKLSQETYAFDFIALDLDRFTKENFVTTVKIDLMPTNFFPIGKT